MGDERDDRTDEASLGEGRDPVGDADLDRDATDGALDGGGTIDGGGHVLPDEVEYPELGGPGTALPRRVDNWRRRSATGAMLTGFAFGLREVLEPPTNGPSIVLETSGVPPTDLPVEAELDSLPPRQSVVKVRRWLLSDAPAATDGEQATPAEAPASDVPASDASSPTEIRRRERAGRRRGERSRPFGLGTRRG